MPGSALILMLGLATAAEPNERTSMAAAERFSVGLPIEANLVGLSFGVHPELLYRPFRPDGWFHLRAATGFTAGPELSSVPLSLGFREVFFFGKRVQPGLGAGVQLQNFIPYGHAPVTRLDMTMEATLDVQVAEGWTVGAQLSPEFGMVGGFGLGMATRIGVRRDLP